VLPEEVCGSVVDFALNSVLKTDSEDNSESEEEEQN